MKLVERFDTIEKAQEAINVVEVEIRNSPDALAEIFGFNLSRLALRFTGIGHTEMPVSVFQREEVSVCQAFFEGKTKEDASQMVGLVKSVLTEDIIPSFDFLKFMRLVVYYPTIEAAQTAFARLGSTEINNDPNRLANALGLKFDQEGLVTSL